MRRLHLVLGALAFTVLASGCPQPNDDACGTPSDDLMADVADHLTEGGHIRFAVTHRPDGDERVFVSFENRTDDQVQDDDNGHILTVALPDEGSPDLVAVDERARKETDLPGADFDVRADGGVHSRGCVVARRNED